MKIKIINIGKTSKKDIVSLINSYKKRISRFVKIEIIEYKESNLENKIKRETEYVLSKLNNKEYNILLDIDGNNISTKQFYNTVNNNNQNKKIVFIIGGSHGFDNSIYDKIDFRLSLGKLTYPHQIAKLLLMEQIYRIMTIKNNLKYDH